MAREREENIAFHRNYCRHYAPLKPEGGMAENLCGIGCDRAAMKPTPCIGGHDLPDALAICLKWDRRTQEEGEAWADQLEESDRRFALVFPVVSMWRKQLPKGKREVIVCPACQGKLHLAQAASNGHLHGRCETTGCVSWME